LPPGCVVNARAEKAPKGPSGPKIIVQYRAKNAKVYELQTTGGVVAVRISQDADTAVPSGWHVDAQSGPAGGPSTVAGWGTTAAEALKEVARAWNSQCPALAVFDWEAIARELHIVQAI